MSQAGSFSNPSPPPVDPTLSPVGMMSYMAVANGDAYLDGKWLQCNGQLVNQADYPELFDRVGLINPGGTIWSSGSGITSIMQGLAFNGSIFVATGQSGSIFTSSDEGATWTSQTSGTASGINEVVFGNGIFAYAGTSGVFGTSPDGINWTAGTVGTTTFLRAIDYGNGLWIVGGDGGVIRTSSDGGSSWSPQTSGTSSSITAIIYAGGLWVYVDAGGNVGTSANGTSWTLQSAVSSDDLLDVQYFNGTYYIMGESSFFASSSDALSWTPISLPSPSRNITRMAYGNGTYILGNGISNFPCYISRDGINFFNLNSLPTTSEILYGNSYFVAVSLNSPFVFRSFDDYTYNTATQFQLPTQSSVNPVIETPAENFYQNLYIKALP